MKTATVEHDGLVTLPESIMIELGLYPGSPIEFEIRTINMKQLNSSIISGNVGALGSSLYPLQNSSMFAERRVPIFNNYTSATINQDFDI